ncbi:kinase-like protein [Rhizoclosmatium globosum]|uniref:Kinase-like protein n=1 Tax=Rhizoclosmatium globosum TaxID=329046 RepID=A0A1Y2CIH2_9FUNG|nr:kinase-like protein [Rhizoclosmatium globosum]|eukprot:ORY46848.1 kinase-like protein [Rhizoclosmatium globosum]
MAVTTSLTTLFGLSKTSSASSTTSTATSTTSSATARIAVPPGLAALASPKTKSAGLYSTLSSEEKARVAVATAFKLSPHKLVRSFAVKRIIGFGSNGVVLAATLNAAPVAIKIIYKNKVSFNDAIPPEIEVLKYINSASATRNSHILHYVEDWQDENHFYLVTELHGNDWLACAPSTSSEDSLAPLTFKATYENASFTVTLPFSAGSSDLWAWSYAHRAHMYSTESHTMLPLHPVKQIIKQTALALQEMHSLGFYHGDVKIENVLVASGGSHGPQVRLADFGHTKHSSYGIKSYGTQEVSPPEFLQDSPYSTTDLDGRAADVFALGMVLYVLLNDHGELPSAVKKVKSGKVGYDCLVSHQQGYYPLDTISELDDSAWNLLFAMTRVDPSTRVTIDQVLAHPFFSDVV